MKNKLFSALLVLIVGLFNASNAWSVPPNSPVSVKAKSRDFSMLSVTQEPCKVGDKEYKVTVKWSNSAGADYYDIMDSKIKNNQSVIPASNGKKLNKNAVTFSYPLSESGQTHYYYARSVIIQVASGEFNDHWSSSEIDVLIGTCPFRITGVVTGQCGNSQTPSHIITWSQSEEAKYYDVYMDGTNSSNIIKSNITGLSYTLLLPPTAQSDKDDGHTYWVRAKKTQTDTKPRWAENSYSQWVSYCLGGFSINKKYISCNGTNSTVALGWEKSKNATEYLIFRKSISKGSSYVKIGSTTSSYPTFTDTFSSSTLSGECSKDFIYTVIATRHFSVKRDATSPVTGTIVNCGPIIAPTIRAICVGGANHRLQFIIPKADNACSYTAMAQCGISANPCYSTKEDANNIYLTSLWAEQSTNPSGSGILGKGYVQISNKANSVSSNTVTVLRSSCPTVPNLRSSTELKETTKENNLDEVNKITLFPNPTTGEFSLNMEGLTTNNPINVTLFDLSGKNVFTSQLMPQNESNAKINIAHLPAGIYLVNIAVEGKEYHQKIIKE